MKPLFRWVGGKTRLLPVIHELIGDRPIRNYHEPFVGGGALFFDLESKKRFSGKAVLSDVNGHLMHAYRQIGSNLGSVCTELCTMRWKPYEELRAELNGPACSVERIAALFIALNHMCFNGLWRVNRSGYFNVPIGKTSSGPRTMAAFDFDRLEEAGCALKNAILISGSFASGLTPVGPGDLEFCDPPYMSEFSSYSKGGFGRSEHEELNYQAREHAARGALVLVCGSNNEASRSIYGEPTRVVELSRTVGASKRGKATEAIWRFGS